MSLLLTHSRKELRELRTLLASITGLTLAVALIAAWVISHEGLRTYTPVIVASASGIGLALALGVDLLGGELRRGTAAFTARIPGGTGTALRSKLLLFVSLIPLAALLGYLLGFASVGVTPDLFGHEHGKVEENLWILALALAIAAWCLPLSCLMPRSAAVLPAAICLFALAFGPQLAEALSIRPLLYLWATPGSWTFCMLVLSPILGLTAGALCYRAVAGGGRDHRAFTRTTLLSTALFLPAPATTWIEVLDWTQFDPNAEAQDIDTVIVDPAGQTAYLEVVRGTGYSHQTTRYLVSVDLQDGSITQHRSPFYERQLGDWYPVWADRTRGLAAATFDGGPILVDTRSGEAATDPATRERLMKLSQSPPSLCRGSKGTELRRVGGRLLEYRDDRPTGRSLRISDGPFALSPQNDFQVHAWGRDFWYLIDIDSLEIIERAAELPIPPPEELEKRWTSVALSKRFAVERGPGGAADQLVDRSSGVRTQISPLSRGVPYSISVASRNDSGSRILLESSSANARGKRFTFVDLGAGRPSFTSVDVENERRGLFRLDDRGHSSDRVIFWDQQDRILILAEDQRELRWVHRDGTQRTVLSLGAER